MLLCVFRECWDKWCAGRALESPSSHFLERAVIISFSRSVGGLCCYINVQHVLLHSPPSFSLFSRTLQVSGEGGTEMMDGFLASLGNNLYTTDANDE